MSRYHNPLGNSYSAEQRKAIANLAAKYDVYIVEDDYMADLGEERGYDPIYAYNRTSHVVYLKSFSKIIFPVYAWEPSSCRNVCSIRSAL